MTTHETKLRQLSTRPRRHPCRDHQRAKAHHLPSPQQAATFAGTTLFRLMVSQKHRSSLPPTNYPLPRTHSRRYRRRIYFQANLPHFCSYPRSNRTIVRSLSYLSPQPAGWRVWRGTVCNFCRCCIIPKTVKLRAYAHCLASFAE